MARSEKTRSTVQAHKMEEMEGDGGVDVGVDSLWAQSQKCQRYNTNKSAINPREPSD